MKKIFLLVSVFTLVCFALSMLFATMGGLQGPFPKSLYLAYAEQKGTRYEIDTKEKYALQGADEVEIEVLSVNVKVERADGPDVEAELRGHFPDVKQALTHEQNRAVLKLKTFEYDFSKPKFTFRLNFSDAEGGLTVKIPAGVKKLTIKSRAGDIKLNAQKLELLALDTMSGDVKLSASEIREVRLKSLSGDVLLDSATQAVEAKSSSGDLTIKMKNAAPVLNVETMSGNVELALPANPNLDLQFHSLSGELKLAPELGSLGEDQKNLKLGAGKGRASLKTMSGDVSVVRL